MKKIVNIILVLVITSIIGLIVWKNSNYKKNAKTIKTEQPFVTTIEEKRFIPGNLYPQTEIDIKSQISGTLEKVFVRIGDKVEIGDDIAQIKLIPDPSNLERAKSNLNSAKINYENNKKVYDRNLELYNKAVIPAIEFEGYKRALDLSMEQYKSAQNQLTLILEGTVRDSDVSNIIKATAAGTIIDLPLKEGSSVIERNNFNNGTTIATVADIDTFIFRGMVNESDMEHLYMGMNLSLNFTAYKNQVRNASLYKVSAKGREEQGIMKYFIEAKFSLVDDSLVIRSGYSANAEIVLQKQVDILAIKEKYLQFQNDTAYVTVVKPEGKEEKRFLTTGLSDGINIEIKKGLKENEKILTNDI